MQIGALLVDRSALSTGLFLFEIGLNLTELWAKAGCPSGRPRANFGGFWAITWPNFNIFAWDLFYMINTPELHHIAKL